MHRSRSWLAALAVLTAVVVTLGADSGATQAALPQWHWPLKTVRIERGYIAPLNEYGAGHRGIDLRAKLSDDIFAPMDARVAFVGVVAGKPVISLVPSFGGSDWTISFEAVASPHTAGDYVRTGETIGTLAAGTHCACLHVGVRWRGGYVSPLLVFGSLPRAVLLPW